MKKKHLFLLSALSAVLFTIGWPVNGFPAFLFVAMVPLFIIEQHIAENRDNFSKFSVFFYTFPAFLLWNAATSWWIWNSTPVAVLAWLFNAMFMGIVFNVFHIVRRNVYSTNKGYFLLPFLWIAFEFVHINWKLTWPWLNLGHGFAVYHKWVQWYEYTGILGGTFWIIAVNILLFKALKPGEKTKRVIYTNSGLAVFLILTPILISYFIYANYKEKSDPVSVVISQPNINPYTEQYSLPPLDMMDRNLTVVEPLIDEKTRFIVAPESAIQDGIWESMLKNSVSLKYLSDYLEGKPNLSIVLGASTYRRIPEGEKIPNSARYYERDDFYYDRFNSAFLVDTSEIVQIHHKSKLTPGVEYMPTWGPLNFLEKFAIDLGGTVGSLGTEKDPVVLITADSIIVAPLICYESVYGEFTTKFINKGADLIFVITNDGWWGNTPGHKQHLYFAPLRAIETRRSIARSANTGISCFVDQRGDMYQVTKYWEPDAIKQDINRNHDITFYVRMGDYIGRVSAFLSVIFILLSFVFSIRKKKNSLS